MVCDWQSVQPGNPQQPKHVGGGGSVVGGGTGGGTVVGGGIGGGSVVGGGGGSGSSAQPFNVMFWCDAALHRPCIPCVPAASCAFTSPWPLASSSATLTPERMRAVARTALVIMSVCFNIDTSFVPDYGPWLRSLTRGTAHLVTHSSCQSKDYENKERINQRCIALNTKLLASNKYRTEPP